MSKNDYKMISLERRKDFELISVEVLKNDCWYCSGIGGLLFFSETEFNSSLFDAYLQVTGFDRKVLILDENDNTYKLQLSANKVFCDVLNPKYKPVFIEPFIKFKVLSDSEFNSLCPPENFVNIAMVTRFYVENYCKRNTKGR
jgi:hypothetical protein